MAIVEVWIGLSIVGLQKWMMFEAVMLAARRLEGRPTI